MADIATILVAAFGAVATVSSGLGGYLISGRIAGRNDAARDERATRREQANRNAALAERLQDQRHEWERQALLELQDEIQKMARQTGRILLQDQKTVREQGGILKLPEGLGGDESLAANVAVRKLGSRVLDDELRSQITSFVAFCAWINTDAVSVHRNDGRDVLDQVITTFMNQLNDLYGNLVDAVGAGLRGTIKRQLPETNSS